MQPKCFLLMPFKQPFNDYYKRILEPSINAGGYKAVRADEIYGTRPIIEDIFREIREANVLVADVTERNPNVNYELGIAHALRKPVVIISQSIDDIPFDYRHFRAIIYDTSKVAWESDLKTRIIETLKTIDATEPRSQYIIAELKEIISRQQEPRRAVLQKLYGALGAAVATLYASREEAYNAITELISNVSATQKGDKHLLLAALHGHSGKRRTAPSYANTAFERFDEEFYKCEMSSGSEMWFVREIYNILDEDRLSSVVKWIEAVGDAEGYEVRAFCLQNALPQLTPLVIGREDTCIGLDDPHYYRVKGAIHVRDLSFAQFATEYFDSLWTDPRIFKLRSGAGVEYEQVDKLREYLKNLNVEPLG